MHKWLREREGVDQGWSEVALTFRARRPTSLRIVSLRSRLVSSRPAPQGHTLLCVPHSESYVERQDLLAYDAGFLVDQDGYESITTADYLAGKEPAMNLGFGEVHQVRLKAHAANCDCTWLIELELEVDGQVQRHTLGKNPSREPFRTMARPTRPGDPDSNIVWCAPDGHGRPTDPGKRDCPIPVDYETPIY